jgi:F-box protein 21
VPGHVHVVVLADTGRNLDDQTMESNGQQRDRMYLDPYGSDSEVTVSGIEQLLAPLELEPSVLTPVPATSVALRTAQNIKASFQRTTTLPQEAWFFMVQLARGHPVVNIYAAYYSSMWASLLLVPAYSADWDLELSLLMKRFAASWPEDAWLIERYLVPLWESFAPFRGPWARHAIPETAEFWKPLHLLREQDEIVPPVISRNSSGTDAIPYKIGQVFRHRRHNRIGIIRGWSRGSNRFTSFHSSDDADHSDDNSGPEAQSPARLRVRVYFVCL